jgi:hypothetical protein
MNDSPLDVTWKQYALMVDLYKFYLDLVVKVGALHYAITGAIVSYYLTHKGDDKIWWALLLPAVLSFGFAAAFLCGAGLHRLTRRHLFDLRDHLNLAVAPETGFLSMFLWILAITLLLAGGGLVYLMGWGMILACAFPLTIFLLSRLYVRLYLYAGSVGEQKKDSMGN